MTEVTLKAQLPAGGNLLKASDLDPAQIQEMLDLAKRMKEAPAESLSPLAGESVACYFERPSTRARVSVQAAAQRLGMLPIMLGPESVPLGQAERAADTARALSAYAAAIVMATASQRLLTQVADAADVPVLNALSELHHPCQALADLLTLRELFRTSERTADRLRGSGSERRELAARGVRARGDRRTCGFAGPLRAGHRS